MVDYTILVVRTDTAYTSDVNDAVATIKEVGGHMGGCILNDVYPEFNLFSMAGISETGFKYGLRYGRYNNKYGGYGKYGKYGRYENPIELSDNNQT